jgi:hypothetical protein
LKEEALDRTMWKACFGKGFGPLVRQTKKWKWNCSFKDVYYKLVMPIHEWRLFCKIFKSKLSSFTL